MLTKVLRPSDRQASVHSRARVRPCSLAAFTLLEIMIVVVIVGILAAVVIPQMASATGHARSVSVQASLGAIRSGIASFRTRAILAGNDPFPTVEQLTTPGTVIMDELPENPYTGLRTLQSVSAQAASDRAVSGTREYGWNYFVDNSSTPPRAVIYCNSEEPTEVKDTEGNFKRASEL
jgi:prepilin-type N-terminal cleavage/methylation domain-containing protein